MVNKIYIYSKINYNFFRPAFRRYTEFAIESIGRDIAAGNIYINHCSKPDDKEIRIDDFFSQLMNSLNYDSVNNFISDHKEKLNMITDVTSDNVELLVLLFGPNKVEKMNVLNIDKNECRVLRVYIYNKLSKYKKYKKYIKQMIENNKFITNGRMVNNCKIPCIMFGFYLLMYCNGLGINNTSDITKK
jgi:hypothetical protein